MAYVRADRVMETSSTTGTGAFTLAGAVSGFRTFASVLSVSDTVHYYIELVGATGIPTGEWETGLGTYSGANTLTRTTVIASSNGGAAVNFSAGTKRVAISHITASVLATQNNLSDLASASTARTNLGLVAGGAGDIWVEKAGDTMTGALTISLASGNSLIVDTNTLVVDATNNRVGIGTSSPNTVLETNVASGDNEFRQTVGGTTCGQLISSGTDQIIVSGGSGAQIFYVNAAERVRITSSGDLQMGGANTVIDSNRHHQLRSYTVAGLPSAATAGQMIYVSNESGGAIPAFSDGTNWRRVTDRAIVS